MQTLMGFGSFSFCTVVEVLAGILLINNLFCFVAEIGKNEGQRKGKREGAKGEGAKGEGAKREGAKGKGAKDAKRKKADGRSETPSHFVVGK